MADPSLVAGIGFLDIGEQEIDAFPRAHARCGLGLGACFPEFPCVESGFRDDDQGFDVVGAGGFQLLGLLQSVDGAVPTSRTDIGVCDVRMRRDLPDAFENRCCAPDVVVAQIRLGGDDGGRHEIAGKLQGGKGILPRTLRIGFQPLAGLGRQQDGLPAVRLLLVYDAGDALLVEKPDGVVPAALPTAVFQGRLCRPGKVGSILGGLLGVLAGRLVGSQPAGFNVETAKPELTGFRILGHAFELDAGVVVPALDQGGLGVEQVQKRLLVGAQQSLCAQAHLAGEDGVAGAGGDQSGGQGLVSPVPLAGAEIAPNGMRRGPDHLDDPPQDHGGGDDGHDRGCGNHQAGLDQVVPPGDRDHAGPVGQPGKAPSESKDDEDERKQSDHSAILSSGCRFG